MRQPTPPLGSPEKGSRIKSHFQERPSGHSSGGFYLKAQIRDGMTSFQDVVQALAAPLHRYIIACPRQ